MKKAIVTGSNGFIGSNVCKRLCADGIKVFAVVKDENEVASSKALMNRDRLRALISSWSSLIYKRNSLAARPIHF